MSDIASLIENLKKNRTDSLLLRDFGDSLRDQTIRSCKAVTQSNIDILQISHSNFQDFIDKTASQELVLENLRVLVNLMADNDDNRKFFINTSVPEKTKFWKSLCQILNLNYEPISERVLIFFSQFIYNTQSRNEFTLFFFQNGVDHSLMTYFRSNIDNDILDFQVLFEIYSNILVDNLEMVLKDNKSNALEYIDLTLSGLERSISESHDLEDLNELILNLSNILHCLTSYGDLPGIYTTNANRRILQLLTKIPADLESVTIVKRKLFSSSGNISSMKTYEYLDDLQLSLEYFKNPSLDPYLLAACAINLGNYVISKEKSQQLKSIIAEVLTVEKFIKNFFDIGFNDVIQYQSYHLLINILDSNISSFVIEQTNLIKATKVILDNEKYYREVSTIFFKFIKKLIKCEFIANNRNVLDYINLWQYFKESDSIQDVEEIHLLLLQGSIQDLTDLSFFNKSFSKELLDNLVSLQATTSEIQVNFLFEKIKTLGIFTQSLISIKEVELATICENIYQSQDSFVEEFLKPLLEFYKMLFDCLEQKNISNQYKVLVNNSKFVSANTLSLMDANFHPVCKQIEETCRLIINI